LPVTTGFEPQLNFCQREFLKPKHNFEVVQITAIENNGESFLRKPFKLVRNLFKWLCFSRCSERL